MTWLNEIKRQKMLLKYVVLLQIGFCLSSRIVRISNIHQKLEMKRRGSKYPSKQING